MERYSPQSTLTDALHQSTDRFENVARAFLRVHLRIFGIGVAIAVSHTDAMRQFLDSLCEAIARRRAARLRQSTIGKSKHAVASLLGPPPTAVGASSVDAYLLARTWYYPISAAHRVAIAIEFAGDVACDAHVLRIAD